MAQNGFLLVLMQPPENIEEEFNAWYDSEHVPERLAVPGVLTAIRFSSISAVTPKYLAMWNPSRCSKATPTAALPVTIRAHGQGA
jgi:hypothetical protein